MTRGFRRSTVLWRAWAGREVSADSILFIVEGAEAVRDFLGAAFLGASLVASGGRGAPRYAVVATRVSLLAGAGVDAGTIGKLRTAMAVIVGCARPGDVWARAVWFSMDGVTVHATCLSAGSAR